MGDTGQLVARPASAYVPSLLLGASALAGIAVTADAGGRLLVVPVVLALVAAALRELLAGPALRADTSGLDVVVGAHRQQVRWHEVAGMQVVRDRRATLLELDLGDRVVVLGPLRLGRSPGSVLADLLALQGGGPGQHREQ